MAITAAALVGYAGKLIGRYVASRYIAERMIPEGMKGKFRDWINNNLPFFKKKKVDIKTFGPDDPNYDTIMREWSSTDGYKQGVDTIKKLFDSLGFKGGSFDDWFQQHGTQQTGFDSRERKSRDQHPDWWFDKNSKTSIQRPVDKGKTLGTLLQNTTVRHLYLNVAKQETGGTLDYDLFSPTIEGELYDAYMGYYKRLNMAPPHTKEEVSRDFNKIFWSSFKAYAAFKELKRFNDGKLLEIANQKELTKALLYNDPFDAIVGKSVSNSMIHATGHIVQFASESGGIGPVAWVFQEPVARDLSEATGKGSDVNISNKTWNDYIAQIYNLPLSKAAREYIDYMLDGVWYDDEGEDSTEYFVFHAPYNADSDDIYGSTAANYLEVFNTAKELAIDTLASDRAYTPIMGLLGLGSESTSSITKGKSFSAWADLKPGFLSRDPASKTIRMFKCDDAFYTALANSVMAVATFDIDYSEETGIAKGSNNKTYYVKPEYFNPSDDVTYITFGKSKVFTIDDIDKVEITPKLTEVMAGEIASATKWSVAMTLVCGPTIAMYANGYKICNPYIGSPNGVLKSGAAPRVVYDTQSLAIQDSIFNGGNGALLATLPGNFGCTYQIYNETGLSDKDRVEIARDSASYYDRVTLYNAQAIFDYAYCNLFFNVSALHDIVKELSAIKEVSATLL